MFRSWNTKCWPRDFPARHGRERMPFLYLNDIANQIVTNQSLENIKFDDNSKYTYTILYNAILDTIEKGKVGE